MRTREKENSIIKKHHHSSIITHQFILPPLIHHIVRVILPLLDRLPSFPVLIRHVRPHQPGTSRWWWCCCCWLGQSLTEMVVAGLLVVADGLRTWVDNTRNMSRGRREKSRRREGTQKLMMMMRRERPRNEIPRTARRWWWCD
jgi:hypothetical protein